MKKTAEHVSRQTLFYYIKLFNLTEKTGFGGLFQVKRVTALQIISLYKLEALMKVLPAADGCRCFTEKQLSTCVKQL